MKINKFLLGLSVVLLGGLTSCNTDVEGVTYSTDLSTISFENSDISVSVPNTESEVNIPVTITRGVTKADQTVRYTTQASADGIFTDDGGGVVAFAAGQNSAVINVKAANLEKEVTYTYVIKLGEEAEATADTIANTPQVTTYTITVQREGDWSDWAKWNSTGTATYTYVNIWKGDDTNLPFVYRYSLNDPNKCQLKLSNWGYGVELVLDYDRSSGIVSCASQFTGYTDEDYGDVYVMDLVAYCGVKGWDVEPGDYGKFDEVQGIITLPLAYYVPAGSFGYKPEYIYIDGYVHADYSITGLTYAGIFTNPDNETFAMANLELAADAKNVKAAIVEGDADEAAVADAIASGDFEAVDVTAGQILLPIPEGATGELKLVVVSLDAEGAVASVASAGFEYYGGAGNPWKSIGTGYLTDNFIIPRFYKNSETQEIWTPQTYEVEILENSDHPGMYRIVNAFESAVKLLVGDAYTNYYESANMEVDATDPDGVWFAGVNVGLNGMSISSYGGYFLSRGGEGNDIESLKKDGCMGQLKNGVITLPQIPYYNQNEELEGYFQGICTTASGTTYAGWMDDGIEFKIVLPGAAASVKSKAARMARAAKFERALNGMTMTTAKKFVDQRSAKRAKARKTGKVLKNITKANFINKKIVKK